MVLVDTSVWIDHINRSDPILVDLLQHKRVWIHPYVVGEIALGSLKNRSIVLSALNDLPQAPVATHVEVDYLIESLQLFNRGIGFVDASLIASAQLSEGLAIWTRDKRLKRVAEDMALNAVLAH